EVQGEVLELKETINTMVDRLRIFADEVTRVAREVGTEGKLGGQADVPGVAGTWKGLTDSVNAMANSLTMQVRNIADVATSVTKGDLTRQITVDAQAALEKEPILLQNVPDDYIQITSGLGEAAPRNIIVLPILFEGDVKAVIELASFLPFSAIHQTFLDQLAESIGVVLNMIQANMRTEELLEQSQKLTQELQSQSKELQQQQEELKRSNAELEAQARTLRQSEELLKERSEERRVGK